MPARLFAACPTGIGASAPHFNQDITMHSPPLNNTAPRSSATFAPAPTVTALGQQALTVVPATHARGGARAAANDAPPTGAAVAPYAGMAEQAQALRRSASATPLISAAPPPEPATAGIFQCADAATAAQLLQPTRPSFVKEGGSLLNPLNWPRFAANLFSGTPQRTVGLTTLDGATPDGAGGFVIDGFDDAANAMTGSGVSRQLAAVLQAGVFYPLLLPLVNLGAQGARAEWEQARGELHATNGDAERLRLQLHEDVRSLPVDAQTRLSQVKSPRRYARALIAELKRAIRTDGAQRSPLAQHLAEYQYMLRQQDQCRLACVSAPASAAGTHGMLAGVLCYEGTALAQLLGGVGSSIAAGVLTLVGNLLMGGAQGMMTVYGVLGAIGAGMAHHHLCKQARAYQASSSLRASEPLRAELQANCARRKRLNGIIGAAQAALACGQVLMLLGGPLAALAPLLLPLLPFASLLLFVGAGVTIAAIVVRLLAKRAYDDANGYNPKHSAALTARQADATDAEHAAALIAARAPAVAQLAHSTLLSALNAVTNRTPNGLTRAWHRLTGRKAAAAERLPALRKAVVGMAPAGSALAQALAAQINSAEFAQLCSAPTVPGLTSYLALSTGVAGEPSPHDAYTQLPPAMRLQSLIGAAASNPAMASWSQHVIQQLVIDETARDNKNGEKYADYHTRTPVAAPRTLLPNKGKHAYQFNVEAFQEACTKADWADGLPTDPVLAHVVQAVFSALDKTVAGSLLQYQHSVVRGIDAAITTMVEAEQLTAA